MYFVKDLTIRFSHKLKSIAGEGKVVKTEEKMDASETSASK